MHKIAFVVPTKDRETDLRVMLGSLSKQTRKPDQVIVVDGSDPHIRHVINEFPALNVDYVRVFPPSLSRQRNAGMDQLRSEITLAGYLDDDLELEPEAVERMVAFWERAGGAYGGASFTITNVPRNILVGPMSALGLDHPIAGKVLPTGWVSMFGQPSRDIDVDWLCGGATVWARKVVKDFSYDEWFQGTGFMEDVDFSFNVRGHYKLAVVAAARVAHYHHPVRADRYQLLGRWQIINRLYFVRKYRHRGLSTFKAWCASLSLLAMNIGLSLYQGNLNGLRCAWGNVLGVVQELSGKEKEIVGHLK